MHDQLSTYINKYLSPYLSGFRKGYSTHCCLSLMVERWKFGLDKRKIEGALLTNPTMAFDCFNHELIIANIDTYGFSHSSRGLIFSYLSGRKQRMNNDDFEITGGGGVVFCFFLVLFHIIYVCYLFVFEITGIF